MKNNPVTIKNLVDKFSMVVISGEKNLDYEITTSELFLPGIEFIGYKSEQSNAEIILLGNKEIDFLDALEDSQIVINNIISPNTKMIIVCSNIVLKSSVIDNLKNTNCTLCLAHTDSTSLFVELYPFLKYALGKKELLHADLLTIYGVGVLIQGESGVGKSEIALELIRRGHKFVADDAVITYNINQILQGEPVEHQKHIMEVRGLGLINVYRLFGISAVEDNAEIEFVIELVPDQKYKYVDRLQEQLMSKEINGVSVPYARIPVSMGRNVAQLIEVAVMEFKNRMLGYSATKEYLERFDKLVKGEE